MTDALKTSKADETGRTRRGSQRFSPSRGPLRYVSLLIPIALLFIANPASGQGAGGLSVKDPSVVYVMVTISESATKEGVLAKDVQSAIELKFLQSRLKPQFLSESVARPEVFPKGMFQIRLDYHAPAYAVMGDYWRSAVTDNATGGMDPTVASVWNQVGFGGVGLFDKLAPKSKSSLDGIVDQFLTAYLKANVR